MPSLTALAATAMQSSDTKCILQAGVSYMALTCLGEAGRALTPNAVKSRWWNIEHAAMLDSAQPCRRHRVCTEGAASLSAYNMTRPAMSEAVQFCSRDTALRDIYRERIAITFRATLPPAASSAANLSKSDFGVSSCSQQRPTTRFSLIITVAVPSKAQAHCQQSIWAHTKPWLSPRFSPMRLCCL
jgi:hypothetical protein